MVSDVFWLGKVKIEMDMFIWKSNVLVTARIRNSLGNVE